MQKNVVNDEYLTWQNSIPSPTTSGKIILGSRGTRELVPGKTENRLDRL